MLSILTMPIMSIPSVTVMMSMLSMKMTSVSREGKVQVVFKLDAHVA